MEVGAGDSASAIVPVLDAWEEDELEVLLLSCVRERSNESFQLSWREPRTCMLANANMVGGSSYLPIRKCGLKWQNLQASAALLQ